MIIMNNYIRQLLTLTLCFCGLVQLATAETLEDAWLISGNEDKTIEAAQIRVEAAEADLAASQGTRWPTVVARASATQYNETPAFDFTGAGLPGQLPLFDGSSQLMADARITLPIFSFGMSCGRGCTHRMSGWQLPLRILVCCVRVVGWKLQTVASVAL